MEDLIQLDWPDFNKKRIGQLFICEGGTCGQKEKGAHPIPIKKIKEIMKNEGMNKYFKLTVSPCLGVCKPHNVMLLLTPKEQIWLGMFRDGKPYEVLIEWIRSSVKEGVMLPIPEFLVKHKFDRFAS